MKKKCLIVFMLVILCAGMLLACVPEEGLYDGDFSSVAAINADLNARDNFTLLHERYEIDTLLVCVEYKFDLDIFMQRDYFNENQTIILTKESGRERYYKAYFERDIWRRSEIDASQYIDPRNDAKIIKVWIDDEYSFDIFKMEYTYSTITATYSAALKELVQYDLELLEICLVDGKIVVTIQPKDESYVDIYTFKDFGNTFIDVPAF